jgi:hypothetical protein
VKEPLFSGLVYSEDGRRLDTTNVGDEPFYVMEDDGFRRHIHAREVDEAVLRDFWGLMQGHEKEVADQAARMTGQEDIFSRAVIQEQLAHPDRQIEQILHQEIPEDVRIWLGMMGLRIVLNYHGEVVRVEQPGRAEEQGE